MKRVGIVLCGMAIGLLASAAPAQAALITGQLKIGGGFIYDNLFNPALPLSPTNFPGAAGLDFEDQATVPPPPNSTTGPVVEVATSTGYFFNVLGITIGEDAEIQHITNVNPPTNVNYDFLPAGVPVNFTNFLLNFEGAAGLHYDVTEFLLQTGTAPPCPATPICAAGPFQLSETAAGLDISFDFLGNFVNGPDSGKFLGHFVVSLAGLTLEETNQKLASGQDIGCGPDNDATASCAFAATFTPVAEVPEPATLLTFGLGSALLARARRRKKA